MEIDNTILEGNRKLADFAGVKYYMMRTAEYPDGDGFPHFDNKHQGYKPLEFHSDWNFIHHVWITFRDLTFSEETHQRRHNEWHLSIRDKLVLYDIPLYAFRVLFAAIEWYNSLKQYKDADA